MSITTLDQPIVTHDTYTRLPCTSSVSLVIEPIQCGVTEGHGRKSTLVSSEGGSLAEMRTKRIFSEGHKSVQPEQVMFIL